MSENEDRRPACTDTEVLTHGLYIGPLDKRHSPEQLAKNIVHLLHSLGLKCEDITKIVIRRELAVARVSLLTKENEEHVMSALEQSGHRQLTFDLSLITAKPELLHAHRLHDTVEITNTTVPVGLHGDQAKQLSKEQDTDQSVGPKGEAVASNDKIFDQDKEATFHNLSNAGSLQCLQCLQAEDDTRQSHTGKAVSLHDLHTAPDFINHSNVNSATSKTTPSQKYSLPDIGGLIDGNDTPRVPPPDDRLQVVEDVTQIVDTKHNSDHIPRVPPPDDRQQMVEDMAEIVDTTHNSDAYHKYQHDLNDDDSSGNRKKSARSPSPRLKHGRQDGRQDGSRETRQTSQIGDVEAASEDGVNGPKMVDAKTSTVTVPPCYCPETIFYRRLQYVGRESRHAEFKKGGIVNDQAMFIALVGKYVCGFLNSGGGTLYLGVRDDGVVLGIETSPKNETVLLNDITESVGEMCPAVGKEEYVVNFAKVMEDDEEGEVVPDLKVLEICVHPRVTPENLYSYRSEVYVRRDGSLQNMKGGEAKK